MKTPRYFEKRHIIGLSLQAIFGLRRSQLTLFRGTNAPHKNIKNIIEAVELDYCDQELQ